jgi:hypothetical protein
MSAWNMTSVAPVSALDFEVSRSHTCTFPTWRRNEPGVRLVSRPRSVRREAVVSLDASRTTAMLLRCGSLIGVDVVLGLVQRIPVITSLS